MGYVIKKDWEPKFYIVKILTASLHLHCSSPDGPGPEIAGIKIPPLRIYPFRPGLAEDLFMDGGL